MAHRRVRLRNHPGTIGRSWEFSCSLCGWEGVQWFRIRLNVHTMLTTGVNIGLFLHVTLRWPGELSRVLTPHSTDDLWDWLEDGWLSERMDLSDSNNSSRNRLIFQRLFVESCGIVPSWYWLFLVVWCMVLQWYFPSFLSNVFSLNHFLCCCLLNWIFLHGKIKGSLTIFHLFPFFKTFFSNSIFSRVQQFVLLTAFSLMACVFLKQECRSLQFNSCCTNYPPPHTHTGGGVEVEVLSQVLSPGSAAPLQTWAIWFIYLILFFLAEHFLSALTPTESKAFLLLLTNVQRHREINTNTVQKTATQCRTTRKSNPVIIIITFIVTLGSHRRWEETTRHSPLLLELSFSQK